MDQREAREGFMNQGINIRSIMERKKKNAIKNDKPLVTLPMIIVKITGVVKDKDGNIING